MLSVQNYAYINARLRSRLTQLLTHETLMKMIQAPSLDETLASLEGTYYDEFYQAYKKSGDLMIAEQALSQMQMSLFAHMGTGLASGVRGFMQALLMMHEVRFLKTALRVWFAREIGQKHANLLFMQSGEMTIAYHISYDAIMACASLAEVTAQLMHTPYAKIIEENESQILSHHSIYQLEVALDRFVFANIARSILLLPAIERIPISQLMGAYIDLENILFGKGFILYGMDKTISLEKEFIAGGARLDKTTWQEILYDDQRLKEKLVAWYPALQEYEDKTLAEFVQLAQMNLLLANGRRALTYYPFSCAPIVAYFFLVEHDINRIVTLANSKVYHLSSDEAMHNIMMV